MSGQQEQKPRWKRAMSVPNGTLGEAVGEMYVAKYFPEKDKERMMELVKNLQTALGQHIDALDWMSDTTKAKAREKLATFTVKIGYPDKWKDYTTLEIDRQRATGRTSSMPTSGTRRTTSPIWANPWTRRSGA